MSEEIDERTDKIRNWAQCTIIAGFLWAIIYGGLIQHAVYYVGIIHGISFGIIFYFLGVTYYRYFWKSDKSGHSHHI